MLVTLKNTETVKVMRSEGRNDDTKKWVYKGSHTGKY
jgi:hypothetical protein